MSLKRASLLCVVAFFEVCSPSAAWATEQPPPVIETFTSDGSQKSLRFEPYPAAQAYQFLTATNGSANFYPNTNFHLVPYITGYLTNIVNGTNQVITNFAYEWRLTNFNAPSAMFRVGVTPLRSNAVLSAHVLNRLAYGPTPDELERLAQIGPQAFIDEQLNFNANPVMLGNFISETTNSIPSDPTAVWTSINMTGRMASTTFYLFTTQPGDIYVDDIEIRPYIYMQQITTNIVDGNIVYVTNRVFSHVGTNVLVNSGFESGMTSWTAAGGASTSTSVMGTAHSGSRSLRVVSTSAATSPGSSYVRQVIPNTYLSTNSWGQPVLMTYQTSDPLEFTCWYLPSTNSSKLRLQLGSGLNSTPGGIPPTPKWIYAEATGTADSTPRLYLYLSGAGECYIDDLKLVAGTQAGMGPNLVQNGDFEAPLAAPWVATADFTNSQISSTVAHSGNGSLRLVATASGSGNNDSLYQTVPVVNGQTYTVSFWYLPSRDRNLTVRLSGSRLSATPDTSISGTYRRLLDTQAAIGDYRAWFCQHAVNSPQQLFEIMSQFWENHFVTQYSKSRSYLTGRGYSGTAAGILATDWEFREMIKWRNAMLNPDCTFYDLLKISVESPAMIVYLDTVNSRGNANNIANENFARELLELFTFGVDNGYDQEDIVRLSRAWTGWSVELVDAAMADNPFAPASATYYPGTNSTSKANTVGVWAFNYKAANHGTNRGPIFEGKTVPARFGPPWAGKPYQLVIPPRVGTGSIQDGYDVIEHLANLPFTAEYLSVKLCRLFVHEDFPNPTTTPGHAEYDFYDYTRPDLSPEAALVRDCMLAWENSSPKGNIRAVLNTIFSSELFRSQKAIGNKVKTPLEFVASSVRALRSDNGNGTFTASTDGYSFATRLSRMGEMNLFDRGDPDGYPEFGSSWISAGTLVERIRYIQAFCRSGTGDDAGNHVCDPVALLKKKLPPSSWNNPVHVADYFVSILFPGEGAANLTLYRDAAVNFLNLADNGTTVSSFAGLGNTSTTYDTRVRGMVSMLMTMQRFQEQ